MTTGKTRYRTTWLGKLVLQVQHRYFVFGEGWKIGWRDATVKDLT